MVELVHEATGAAEDEIKQTLQECGNDVNLATTKLIDGAHRRNMYCLYHAPSMTTAASPAVFVLRSDRRLLLIGGEPAIATEAGGCISYLTILCA